MCKACSSELHEGANFCIYCGASVKDTAVARGERDFIIVTTPTVPGYKTTNVRGVVTGLTPRTRGMLGRFVGGLQAIIGGEVTAFTTEIEKAREEAISRMKAQARVMGANAIVGLDMETSDLLDGLIVISATGTAVVVEPEK